MTRRSWVCDCPRPTHPAVSDHLHCVACDRPTPAGPLPPPASFLSDLAGRLADEYRWAYDLSHDPTHRHEPNSGHAGGHSDPTGTMISDDRRHDTRALTVISARRLDNAIVELRAAFAALGAAVRVQDHPGPADHVPAPYHDPQTLFLNRPDLADAHAAQGRRKGRGEL